MSMWARRQGLDQGLAKLREKPHVRPNIRYIIGRWAGIGIEPSAIPPATPKRPQSDQVLPSRLAD